MNAPPRTLVAIAVAALLFTIASTFWYVSYPGIQLPFDTRTAAALDVLKDFYAPETTPQGTTFAWTDGDGRIELRDPDRRTEWRATIRLARGAWPAGAAPPTVTFEIDRQAIETVTPRADFTSFVLTIPRSPRKRGLDLELRSPTFVPGGSDSRQLGVAVNQVSLQPLGFVLPSAAAWAATVVSGASLAALCAMAGLGTALTCALLTEFGLTYGWLIRFALAPDSGHAAAPWQIAGLILVATAVAASAGLTRDDGFFRVARRAASGARHTVARVATVAEIATHPLVLATVVHLIVLALRVPLFGSLPWWYFHTSTTWLGPWYLLTALGAIPFVGWWVARRLSRAPAAALCLLVLLGYALQQGFAWSEGRGVAGIRDRISGSEHAEFAQVAVRQPSMWDVLVGYEAKLQRNELGDYARAKPPGQLLFYQATERAARMLTRDRTEDARLQATYTLAAVAWPLLSFFVLFPLFFSLRALVPDRTALLACVLFLVIPSVELLTMHTDQVLFPLLFMLTVWTAVVAQQKRSWVWAFVCGVALYVSGFFTFALLLSAPIAVGFAVAIEMRSGRVPKGLTRWNALIRTALALLSGFSAMFLVCAVAFRYDFAARLRGALLFHEQWKGWHAGLHNVLYFAWLDDVEFALFLGVPLTILTLGAMRRAILVRGPDEARTLTAPALALLGVFLYLSCFSHTKAETSRLWMPLVPLCCGLAANELQQRDVSTRHAMTAIVIALQWLTVWLTRTAWAR